MKIAAINGSPKTKGSLSGLILEQLEQQSGEPIALYHALGLTREETPPETLLEMLNADALFVVFPLYVDALPAPLVELLSRLARAARDDVRGMSQSPVVYAVVNCGFYEASQTKLALAMVRHFARRAGLAFGYGVGIGCGPMLSSMGKDWSKGLAAGVHAVLRTLAADARQGLSGPDVFTRPKFPRALYKGAAHMGWRRLAGQNGVRGQLRAKPYA